MPQGDTVSGSRAGEQAHTSTVTTLWRCPVCLTWRLREGLSQVSPTLCPPSPLRFPGWVGDSLRPVRRESGFFIFSLPSVALTWVDSLSGTLGNVQSTVGI